MKVLVVDDDITMRRLLVRMISRHPHTQVREAVDGVAALAAIEADTPDVVFTDVRMPVLDGVGLLEILRSNPTYHALPVVAVSAVSDKTLVLRMVDLGIEDYLLKPLDPATTAARLAAILEAIQSSPGPETPSGEGTPTLILVDRDADYADVIRSAFGERLHVVDGHTAASALEWSIANRPAIALIAVGQRLPTEAVFARTLKSQAPTRVVLLTDASETGGTEGFDAVVRRSFVPARLREALEPVLAVAHDDERQLRALLAGPLREALTTACRQSIGIIAGQESEPAEAAAEGAMPVAAHARLTRDGGPCIISILLETTAADAKALAGSGAADGSDTLTAVVGAASARLTQALAQRGWTFISGEAEGGAADLTVDAADGRVELRTEQGATVRASLHLFRAAPPPAVQPELTQASPAVSAG
ncbi:MAG: response regulator [Gemmatimonadota bacterium]